MKTYEKLQRAFEIFAKYPGTQSVSAEHDVIYAGPKPGTLSALDGVELTDLGWEPNDEYECWEYFP